MAELDPRIILEAGKSSANMPMYTDTQKAWQSVEAGNIQLQQDREQMAARDAALKLAEEKRALAARAGGMAASGDFAGANKAALDAGDFDIYGHVKGLQDDQRAALGKKIGAAAPIAFEAAKLPYEQRKQYIAAGAQQLANAGWTAEEIAGFDPTDQNISVLVASQQTIADALKRHDDGLKQGEVVRHNQAMEGRPVALAPGGMLIAPDGSSLGGAAAVGGGSEAISSGLSAAGMSAPVIAGFLGNFEHESQLGQNKNSGDGGTAHGLAQWRFGRVSNFEKVIGKHPSEASIPEQVQFVAWEMQNPEAAGMTVAQRDAILASKTPEQAADRIDRFYERSNGKSRGSRQQAARSYFSPEGGGARVIASNPKVAKPGDAQKEALTSRKEAMTLRKEFDQLPEVKNFKTVRTAYKQIEALTSNPKATAQDDIAAIFTFMKALDPTSTVREGEFATAQNATGIPDRIRNLYNKAAEGTRLNPAQRAEMRSTASRVYVPVREAYNETAKRYQGYAADAGIEPLSVAPHYIPKKSGAKPSANLPTMSPEQARSAPKGTRFRTTDGRVMVKQ
jgi:hypothetical protein